MAFNNDTLLVAANSTLCFDGVSIDSVEVFVFLLWILYRVGVAIVEIIFLGSLLIVAHYYCYPRHYDLIYKPNQTIPRFLLAIQNPEAVFLGCRSFIDINAFGLHITAFSLLLPLLGVFLLLHLFAGGILWCCIPAYLRPLHVVHTIFSIACGWARLGWPFVAKSSRHFVKTALLGIIEAAGMLRKALESESLGAFRRQCQQAMNRLIARALDWIDETDWEEEVERAMRAIDSITGCLFHQVLPALACAEFQPMLAVLADA